MHVQAASAVGAIAEDKGSSTFVLVDTQLVSNTAKGAGGAVFGTSTEGVYLICNSDPLNVGKHSAIV